MLIVGDSLAVGMRPYLKRMITNRKVTFDVRHGRTTPEGLERLRDDLQFMAPQTIVVSLGTNDGSNAELFADRVRRLLHQVDPRRASSGRRSSARRARARTRASTGHCDARPSATAG